MKRSDQSSVISEQQRTRFLAREGNRFVIVRAGGDGDRFCRIIDESNAHA